MATMKFGVQSAEIQEVQKRLNAAYRKNVVRTDGQFDEKMATVVAEFQSMSKLPTTGEVDDRTLDAINWAMLPKKVITYKGHVYYVTQGPQYQAVSKALIAKSSEDMEKYVRLASSVKGLWDEQKKVRDKNVFFGFIVETWGSANFPAEAKMTEATAAADTMQKAAKSGDFKAYTAAVNAGLPKIAAANKAMNEYYDKLYEGGADLVEKLEALKEGCVITLEICAAFATAGESVAVTGAVMGGLGSYESLLTEVDTASTKSNYDWNAAGQRILVDGAVNAAVGMLMKGKGDAFAKAVGEELGSRVAQYGGSKAIQTFVSRAMEGATKEYIAELLKDLGKAANPADKMTVEDAFSKAAAKFVKGALFGQLDGVLKGFGDNYGKYFNKADFKGLGNVDLNKAMKDGGSKALDIGYDKALGPSVEAANGDPTKIPGELKKRMVADPAVQKWFAEYGKKQK